MRSFMHRIFEEEIFPFFNKKQVCPAEVCTAGIEFF